MLPLFPIFLYLLALSPAENDSMIIERSNEQRFNINVNTNISYNGKGTANVDMFLGLLQSNAYQTVHSVHVDPDTEKQLFGFSGDSCAYYPLEVGRKTALGKRAFIHQKYELSVFDIQVNFDLIDSMYPYNEQSATFRKFTCANTPFIDTKNQQLKKVADSIWQLSDNALDYTRKCYEYVPLAFDYLDPISGFHSMETILEKGGGDCGNLASVFITLLRIKGIPARHLVGFRPDNSLHVWADFYLENYGWIPVDVTYKQSDQSGDYFGNIKFENNGFILHRGIGNVVRMKTGPVRIPSLQTFSYTDRYSIQSPTEAIIRRKVTTERL